MDAQDDAFIPFNLSSRMFPSSLHEVIITSPCASPPIFGLRVCMVFSSDRNDVSYSCADGRVSHQPRQMRTTPDPSPYSDVYSDVNALNKLVDLRCVSCL